MACISGEFYTITLSEDGVVHSFGRNYSGQLGLEHTDDISLPTPISNLPKIKQIACGWEFTVCVDEYGFVWSFGENNSGQLGTGNKKEFNFPQQIQNIPPVLSIACGVAHTLIITNDSNLWACGSNEYGQLCLGNQEDQSTFKQTSFSNISKISLGSFYSLFQNNKEEIFACGSNDYGGLLGLGHKNSPQMTPSLIPNLPSNIIQFVCGYLHNLFLDSEGNVFSVGANQFGQLGHNTNQNELNQIPNIPPIQSISCVSTSSYLIDIEGNVWSFGNNGTGQLGHDDRKHKNIPTKIESLKDIQQISYGPCGNHFLAKDSQNRIFATGSNYYGQLGTDTEPILKPREINAEYFNIWGDVINVNFRAKSARK